MSDIDQASGLKPRIHSEIHEVLSALFEGMTDKVPVDDLANLLTNRVMHAFHDILAEAKKRHGIQ